MTAHSNKMKITLSIGEKYVEGEIDPSIAPVLLDEVVKVMCQELIAQLATKEHFGVTE